MRGKQIIADNILDPKKQISFTENLKTSYLQIIMWFKIKTYVRFLLRSFHLHGIHSPFVFQLGKVCFSEKKEAVLPRLIDYLKIETILVFGNASENDIFNFQKTVFRNPNGSALDSFLKENRQFDLVYFPTHTENLVALFQKTLPIAHNDTVFVFEKIHDSKEMEEIWERIKQTKKVRVSIDIFYLGLVFFRKEQAKEHFVVRGNAKNI